LLTDPDFQEAPPGFEPGYDGFAIRCLRPLGYGAGNAIIGNRNIRTSPIWHRFHRQRQNATIVSDLFNSCDRQTLCELPAAHPKIGRGARQAAAPGARKDTHRRRKFRPEDRIPRSGATEALREVCAKAEVSAQGAGVFMKRTRLWHQKGHASSSQLLPGSLWTKFRNATCYNAPWFSAREHETNHTGLVPVSG
jgi:hypothetical protein